MNWWQPFRLAPTRAVKHAGGELPDARSYFSCVEHLVKQDRAREAWCSWCDILDAHPSIVPTWTEAEPEDSVRLYDADLRLRGEELASPTRHQMHLVMEVYQVLRLCCGDVSDAWGGKPEQLSSRAGVPTEPSTWRLLQELPEPEHWLDLRDNALKVLAAHLALTPGEIANLRLQHLVQGSHLDQVFVDVMNRQARRLRSVVAEGQFARALLKWKDFLAAKEEYGVRWLIAPGRADQRTREVQRTIRRMVRRLQLQNGIAPDSFSWSGMRERRLMEMVSGSRSEKSIRYLLGASSVAVQRARERLQAELSKPSGSERRTPLPDATRQGK